MKVFPVLDTAPCPLKNNQENKFKKINRIDSLFCLCAGFWERFRRFLKSSGGRHRLSGLEGCMRLVTVKLESLAPGQEIVSDVHDSLGRLLLKAPQSLDESMKKILLSRGIVDVVIEDRRSSPRVEDSLAVERELEALNTRMSLFQSFDEGKEFYRRVRETVSRYYHRKK